MPIDQWAVPASSDPGFSIEEMKRFVRNHFEVFVNRKDSSQAERSFSADFLDHDAPTGTGVGIHAARLMMERAYKRWPDLDVEVKDILAEGDKVMVRNRWTGTENDGTRIAFEGLVLWRFADKKIVERWATITAPKPIDPPPPLSMNQPTPSHI
jgi:predicted ester cyclase